MTIISLQQCILGYWQSGEIIQGYQVVSGGDVITKTTAIKVHEPISAPKIAIFVLAFRTTWKVEKGLGFYILFECVGIV